MDGGNGRDEFEEVDGGPELEVLRDEEAPGRALHAVASEAPFACV